MKTISVIFTALGLTILGYMIIKGANPDTTQSSIFMHPSNFDKPPIEQVEKMKAEDHEDIPNLHDLTNEDQNPG